MCVPVKLCDLLDSGLIGLWKFASLSGVECCPKLAPGSVLIGLRVTAYPM